MIKAVTITNYLGDSITLDLLRPESSGFAVKQITGLGPVKAEISMTTVASSDGESFNSARLGSRNIVLSLEFLWAPTIEEVRLKSYKYFPSKKPITLLIETDNRTAEIQGVVESNEPDIFSKQQGSSISIICPNPYFYSAGINGTKETIFSGIEANFEFDFENNSLTEDLIEFGVISNLTQQTVYYSGDADVGITMVIHALGEATNVSIYNLETRESIKIDTTKLATLTGHGIIAGDEITITTIKGSKTIYLLRDGTITNILNCLVKGYKWFQLTKGDNLFTYTAESGSTNLQFRIINKIAYEGV